MSRVKLREERLTEASWRGSSWMAGVGGVSYGRKTNGKKNVDMKQLDHE